MKNALSHRPETFSAREMTAPSSARPFLYSSSQMSAREDSWVVNGVSTTGTRWSCSWFWSPTLPTTSPRRCSPSSTSAATTSTWLRQEDPVYPPGVADGGLARDGGLGVLPGHRGEPLFQAAAPAQCGVMRAAATHTPSPTSPRDAVLLCGLQTALCSSLRIGQAGGDTELSSRIQQMIKRTIKNPGLSRIRNSRHQQPRSWTSRPSMMRHW